MSHTKQCLEWQAEIAELQRKYDELYPNYCKECNGDGGFVFYESHGLPGPKETLYEPCEACVMVDKCPRCGYDHSKEEGIVVDQGWFYDVFVACLSCGWIEEDNSGGRPIFDGCSCDFLLGEDNIQ